MLGKHLENEIWVQHKAPKIVKQSHCVPAHLLQLYLNRPTRGIEYRPLLFKLLARTLRKCNILLLYTLKQTNTACLLEASVNAVFSSWCRGLVWRLWFSKVSNKV